MLEPVREKNTKEKEKEKKNLLGAFTKANLIDFLQTLYK